MLTCSECGDALVRTRDPGDPQWICARCRSRVLTLGGIARVAQVEFGRALRQEIDQGVARPGARCPSCARPMRDLAVPVDSGACELGLCTTCRLVRLDADEHAKVPLKSRYAPGELFDAAEARRQIAIAQVKLETQRYRASRSSSDLDDLTWWQRALSLLGMPVDVDAPPDAPRPWCTWAIGAALVVAFLLALPDEDGVIDALGWRGSQPLRMGGLPIVLNFFVHAGWLHLLGNLYFLVAFGAGVERRVGKLRMGLLLLVAQVVGNVAHALLDPRGDVPLVGASGGISGLILAYAAAQPWNRFAVTLWIVIPRTFAMPAIVWAALWLLWQLVGFVLQMYGGGDVSALAHLGGALAGVAAWLLWRKIK